MKMKVYEYTKCTTCKKAMSFLEKKKVAFDRYPIVEKPPTLVELKKMLALKGGEIKKLFNTSGILYRELKISAKLPKMSEDEALKLLASNGMLVKRPFLLSDKGGAVGFKEDEWKKLV